MPPKSHPKRLQILEATESIFRRGLDHEVTIEDVARVAQVSKGTIYVHFADKDELFFEAEVYRMNGIVEQLRAEVPESLPFLDRLFAVGRELHAFFEERVPILAPFHWNHPLPSPEGDRRREHWRTARGILRDYLASIMQQGVDEGVLRGDVDPQLAARHLMYVMRARRLELMSDPEATTSLEETLSLLVFGIARGGSGGLVALQGAALGDPAMSYASEKGDAA